MNMGKRGIRLGVRRLDAAFSVTIALKHSCT